MMRTLLLVAGLPVLLSAACGGPEPSAVAFQVRIDAQLRNDIASVAVYALGPDRSDGIQLTCTTLMPRAIDPNDARVEVLDRVEYLFIDPDGRQARLENVAAGSLRIVYVEGKDASKEVIANGCVDEITVREGKTVEIDVPVYPYP